MVMTSGSRPVVASVAALIAVISMAGSPGADAAAPPTVRIKPSTLPAGAESATPRLDFDKGQILRRGKAPINLTPLAREGEWPNNILQASGGWLVPFQSARGSRVVFVGTNGASRTVRDWYDQPAVVSTDGRSYIAERFSRKGIDLRLVRIADGKVLAGRRFASGEVTALAIVRSRVLLVRQIVSSRQPDAAARYDTLWWTPRTNDVSRVSSTTQRPSAVSVPAGPPASLVSARTHTIIVREGRRGQTTIDSRTRRPLWRLPDAETAVNHSPTGEFVATFTDHVGTKQVNTIRVRNARSGRVVAAFRGTTASSSTWWESPSMFLVRAAEGTRPDEEGGTTWYGQRIVRCSIRTHACNRAAGPVFAEPARPLGKR